MWGKKAKEMRRRRDHVTNASQQRRLRYAIAAALACVPLVRFLFGRSIALQGLALAPAAFPGVSGVPRRCGSDARNTWLWMNPANFNGTTTPKHLRPRRVDANATKSDGGTFLVGCGHSGTTPLAQLLARHPSLWLYAPDAALEFSVKPSSFAAVPPNSLLTFVSSQRAEAGFSRGARKAKGHQARWLVKSPSNVCRLGYILRTLPASRLVHLVRDGRDVMLSLLERYPTADAGGPLVLQRWVNDNRAALLYGRDPRLLVVRYEDLFSHRARGYPTLKRVLRHVGVALEPLLDMVNARPDEAEAPDPKYKQKPVASEAHTALRAEQIKRPFKRAEARWPTQMTPALAQIFKRDESAVELLRRFGYANNSDW
ncbi:P-loop containing nucleoside triphosphate hydrolase protein [Pelagophyceae sp. CCMP2097]|nr:P-loop containing nucleoside triphosphate hydrolase protein [Pelagophyceae sp. CCMP2097]